MKLGFSNFNEKLFSSGEISSIGTVGTMRLLRGGVARFLNFLGRSLAYSSTRSYGCFLISFGFLSLVLQLGEYYFKAAPNVPISSLAVSLILALVAIPLLVFSKPMCVAVQDFYLTDKLLFDFLSIKRMHRNTEQATVSPILAMFLGFIPATVGFFLSVEWVIIAIFVAVIVILAFVSPEFSMILTIISLPYLSLLPHPVLSLCSLSVMTFISFAMKVVIGKRTFYFDIYSAIIFLIMILAVISGAMGLGGDSLKNSFVFIALVLGYFPISNIIINRRLADSAVNAVIISAIPVAILSLIEFIAELSNAPSYSTPGVSALFSSPSSLSAFLLVSAILTLAFAFEKKKSAKKVFYGAVFVFELSVLCLIMRPDVWLAGIFALLAYSIIKSRRLPMDVLILLVASSHLIYLISESTLDTVFGYFGITPLFSERLSSCGLLIDLFSDNLWLGVGIGSVSSGGGVYNNLLGIGASLGILVLALFCLMLVLRFRHLSYYRHYMRNSLVSVTGDMTAVALIALLSVGVFEFIFADLAVLYIFITVFAISTASLRTARRENDDRLGYYGDSSSSDSSALDISISR